MLPTTLPAQARAILLAALALCACTSSSPVIPDAGPVTGTCSSDAECQTGFKCDVASRQCYCTGDSSCPQGLFCNAFTGLCVSSIAGCTSNSACDAGQYCDAALRACETLTPLCGKCVTDAECGANSFCAANPAYPNAGTFCSPACTPTDGGGACPAAFSCEARDATVGAQTLCFPAEGACGVTNACVPDSLAICTTDASCNDATQVCDTTANTCVAKNHVCPAGDSCDPQQKICEHACATDSDCVQIEGAAGYQCRNNACYQLATCQSDNDCAVHQICTPNPDGSKSCKTGCVQPTDCPIGQGCNNDPSHPACVAGCQVNSDCPLNEICSNAACVSAIVGCSQVCQTTSVCAIGAQCSQSNCCVSANFNSVCANNKCSVNLSTGCLEQYGHSCNNLNDCADLPNTTCQAVAGSTYCAGTLQLQPCTDDSQCPFKGFSCVAYGATESYCSPFENAAIAACFQGHP